MKEELEKAYTYTIRRYRCVRGDKQAVRRLSVLIRIGKRLKLASILALWNVSVQTAHNWLNEFVRERLESLMYEKAPGRPPRLTKSQKRKLVEWMEVGPEACGYASGRWSSVLIQDLGNNILRKPISQSRQDANRHQTILAHIIWAMVCDLARLFDRRSPI